MAETPKLYRVVLQVSDLARAAKFYGELLAAEGRSIRGGRHYFDCGPVILALLDPTAGGEEARPMPDDVYFSVADLAAVHARAKALGCLSKAEVHGEPAGELLRHIVDAVQTFARGVEQYDDVTALVVRYLGPGNAGAA